MRMAGEHAYYYKCTYIRIMCVQHANYICVHIYLVSVCVVYTGLGERMYYMHFFVYKYTYIRLYLL